MNKLIRKKIKNNGFILTFQFLADISIANSRNLPDLFLTGYKQLEIRSPRDLMDYENKD